MTSLRPDSGALTCVSVMWPAWMAARAACTPAAEGGGGGGGGARRAGGEPESRCGARLSTPSRSESRESSCERSPGASEVPVPPAGAAPSEESLRPSSRSPLIPESAERPGSSGQVKVA